jgi:formylglycine-generating enzyme required for sulfatase activity
MRSTAAAAGDTVTITTVTSDGQTATAGKLAATLGERYAAIEAVIGPPKELTLDLGGGVKMELVLIPAGKFLMGSPEGRETNEGPQHEVTISKAFYMGKYEVTQEQWEAVMAKVAPNPSKFKGPKNPVESVSWEQAVGFCEKLSQIAKRPVRLPTEAEWEYACRAGTKTRFSFGEGDVLLGDYAWFSGSANGTTHPVGEKKPNPWGLYDLHGNVWEWCQDWGGPYEAGAVTDPQGPAKGTTRVLRGGSWGNNPGFCRAANRNWNVPDFRINSRGFRVAVVVGPRTP